MLPTVAGFCLRGVIAEAKAKVAEFTIENQLKKYSIVNFLFSVFSEKEKMFLQKIEFNSYISAIYFLVI